jgi:hypothetical protein
MGNPYVPTGDFNDPTTGQPTDVARRYLERIALAITPGAANEALTSNGSALVWKLLTNTNISAAAAIAWTKLSKTGSSLADFDTRSAGSLNSGNLPYAQLPTGSGSWAGAVTLSSASGLVLSDAAGGIKERARSVAMGEWTTRAFAAGNFTANGAMTWTVGSGDVVTDAYTVVGKALTYAFTLNTTTVAGTPNSTLQILIPGSFTAAKTMTTLCRLLDNGTATSGIVFATASSTTISIQRLDAANFSAATDTTLVQGVITCEVT